MTKRYLRIKYESLSRKVEISLAQTYFASQTRKLELAEQEIEDKKRLNAREKFRKSERQIKEPIFNRGIQLPVEFATFKSKGIQALYGISVKNLKEKRNIPKNRALADFENELELKAKDFAYAITDYNIKEKKLQGKEMLEDELISNSKVTRESLLKRGIVPENLEAQKDLKKIEKQRKKRVRKGVENEEDKNLYNVGEDAQVVLDYLNKSIK